MADALIDHRKKKCRLRYCHILLDIGKRIPSHLIENVISVREF